MPINGQSDVASHPQRWLAVQAVPQEGPVDESKEILALLELEFAMIHQLECAAISGAGGAQSTAEKLSTIRSLTEALAQRTNDAQTTAATISRMPVVDD